MLKTLKQKLQTEWSLVDLNIGQNNHVLDNNCLINKNVVQAEETLNKLGFTIAGVCYDVPLCISLGLKNSCLLVLKSLDNEDVYWMHCVTSVVENWLREE